MESLTLFMGNPIVGLVGYVLSLVAALIAIFQFFKKKEAIRLVDDLNAQVFQVNEEIKIIREENLNLQLKLSNTVNNNNDVSQGDKSQFFQDNSGTVNIDNRG